MNQPKITTSIAGVPIVFNRVQAGSFIMGSTKEEIREAAASYRHIGVKEEWLWKEFPAHELWLPDFYIADIVVPNKLFTAFLETRVLPTPQPQGRAEFEPANVPSFDVALKFCEWATGQAHLSVRLPTEAEWEKGARGTDGRQYPWGNTFDSRKCNTRESGLGRYLRVDALAEHSSVYGAIQMAGNIEEWTSSRYEPYPGGSFHHDPFGDRAEYRILRGGKYTSFGDLARCARRHGTTPRTKVGIRLVHQPT